MWENITCAKKNNNLVDKSIIGIKIFLNNQIIDLLFRIFFGKMDIEREEG